MVSGRVEFSIQSITDSMKCETDSVKHKSSDEMTLQLVLDFELDFPPLIVILQGKDTLEC